MLCSCLRGMQLCGSTASRRVHLPPAPARLALHRHSAAHPLATSSSAGETGEPRQEAPPEPPALADERPFRRGEVCEVHVKGVSFGQRQAEVAALSVDDPVLLVREPENAADGDAVAVLTVGGTPLGYVPRHLTSYFGGDTTTGRVSACGRNDAGLYWAVAQAKPVTPGLVADLCPGWPGETSVPPNLSQRLSGALWDYLRTDAYARANQRCVVCDAPKAGPGDLRAIEVWRHDPAARVSRLRNIQAVCAACHSVARLRRPGSGGNPEKQLAQLQVVNGWGSKQAEAYVAWVNGERTRRASLGPWTADCSAQMEPRFRLNLTEEAVAALNTGADIPPTPRVRTSTTQWPEPPF